GSPRRPRARLQPDHALPEPARLLQGTGLDPVPHHVAHHRNPEGTEDPDLSARRRPASAARRHRSAHAEKALSVTSRIFYGWWIVAAGFGIEALIGGLMFHAYGAYVVVLREELGWSTTMLSAAFSMARAERGIFGPLPGWLTGCIGTRALVRYRLADF